MALGTYVAQEGMSMGATVTSPEGIGKEGELMEWTHFGDAVDLLGLLPLPFASTIAASIDTVRSCVKFN